MSRTKIAPVLTAAIVEWVDDPIGEARAHVALRELRALLAVASAAEDADILHDGIHDVGARPKTCAGCRLVRGIIRVRRASSPPSRRSARGTKEKTR